MLRPTLRVARLGLITITVLCGAVPLVVTLTLGGDDLTTPLIILGLVSGAATGWIADDPIAELANPCPVNTPRRIAYRTFLACALTSIGAAAIAAGAAIASSETLELRDRTPEAVAAAAIALACGLVIRRRGDPLAGASGVAVGVLGPLVIAALAFRWSRALPSLSPSPIHDRWWLIAGCAALSATYASRDPATRWRSGRASSPGSPRASSVRRERKGAVRPEPWERPIATGTAEATIHRASAPTRRVGTT